MTRSPRLYTPEEANKVIPKLEALFPKLRDLRDRIIQMQNRSDVEEITSHGLTGDRAAEARLSMDRLRKEIRAGEKSLEKNLKIFENLDCELKGLDPGLVDFYSERDGELVYLCWQEGESEVAYWHSLTGGFARRRPLS